MADEIGPEFIVNQDYHTHYFTITNKAITLGTMMVLATDPRTATPHGGIISTARIPLGPCTEEITTAEGQVKVGVIGRGILDMVADGSITVGALVELGAVANRVRTVTTASTVASSSLIGGIALETASDAERIEVLWRVF